MLDRFIAYLRVHHWGIAATALVIAGGGAFAAGAIPNADDEIVACYEKKGPAKGDVRLLVKGKCVRGERKIAWNQEGLAGNPGPQGPVGPQGDAGQQGQAGPVGPAGSAVGYAHISAAGAFDPNRSKGIAASLVTATNIYCLRFAEPPKNVVATLDSAGAGFATATTDPAAINTNCGVLPGTNAFVVTIGLSAGVLSGAPRAFFVAVN